MTKMLQVGIELAPEVAHNLRFSLAHHVIDVLRRDVSLYIG